MDVSYLIQVLERKIIVLSNAKAQAFSVGDLDGLTTIEQELLSVQNTLVQLHLLADINQAAALANSTPTAVVAGAVSTAGVTVQGPSASAIINGFDISAYATDPLYEQKIQTILNALPLLRSVVEIDVYIQSVAAGSPVTGEMVLAATAKYGIDTDLLVAIMQNDSQFGTLGIGAATNNPGNVGNTGYATQSYPSWQEGVMAVAAWLDAHRITPVQVPNMSATEPASVFAPTTPRITPNPSTPLSTTTPATATSSTAETTSTPIPPVDVPERVDTASGTSTTTPAL